MPDKAWKAFERFIAWVFGGVRRGPDYGDATGGKNDIIVDDWSIECKLYKRPTWSVIQQAMKQAEAAAKPDEIPIAIIKKKHDRNMDAVVCMRLEQFKEWFV